MNQSRVPMMDTATQFVFVASMDSAKGMIHGSITRKSQNRFTRSPEFEVKNWYPTKAQIAK